MGGSQTRRLEEQFGSVLHRLKVGKIERRVLEAFLAPLKYKNSSTHFHYQHSLRVAILLEAIAGFTGFDEKALVYAGALHDIGKASVPTATLDTDKRNWTQHDVRIMRGHVMAGYQMLQGCFNFTAEVMIWHHRFQKGGYPRLPASFHGYSEKTQAIIKNHGRLLALADSYDAAHRRKGRHGEIGLNGTEIREKMYCLNQDVVGLVDGLYRAGIFEV